MEPEQGDLSFEQVLGMLRRRAPWVLLCCVLVGGLAFAYSKHKVKKYTATAAVTFNNNPLSQQVLGFSTGSSSNVVAQQDRNLELVKLGDTAAATARLLRDGLTEKKIDESVSVSVKGETNIVYIAATSAPARRAAAIANVYARQFVNEQQSANRKLFKGALRLVNGQLAKLSPTQRFNSVGLDLEERAHTLSLLTELGYNNAEVAGEALTPTSPSSPKTKRNTLLGALLGLVLGGALVFLLERFDHRIRRPDELEAIYRLPLLGTIPESTALARSRRSVVNKQVPLPQIESAAFSLTWAHLRFFYVNRDLRTLVIASAEAGDGKTIIARHLAEAAARLGSRVLLLEADLRNPTIAPELGIAEGPGLADVLIGDVAIGDAIQSVELDVALGAGAAPRMLSVVTAGAVLPPNPGELLEGPAMRTSLEWAKWSGYEVVVIDTPPLAAVSDAFPLLTEVDGVVLVGRVGRSRRDAAERLEQILEKSEARLLGVIANSSKSGGPEPYPSAGKRLPTGGNPTNETSSKFVPAAKS